MNPTHPATPLDVRHVVVPLDGSILAAAALPTARAVAERFGAELSTVSVAADDRKADRLRAHARHEIAAAALPPDTEAVVVVADDHAAAITQYAQSRDGALIVMSTRGRGRLGGLAGSVAGDVLASAAGTPFMALGPQADRPGWILGRPRRRPDGWAEPLAVGDVVALVDGTAEAEAAVLVAGRWAAALDRELVVLSVAEDALPRLDGTTSNRLGPERPQAYVDSVVERARPFAPSVRGEVVLDPISVPSGVRSYLAAHEVALVVLAAERRTGVARVRHGATAADIVRVSKAPSLVVPAAVRV